MSLDSFGDIGGAGAAGGGAATRAPRRRDPQHHVCRGRRYSINEISLSE